MGFLSSFTKAITDAVRTSAQIVDKIDPLSVSVNLIKNKGQIQKKGILQSGFEEGERYARNNPKVTYAVLPAAGAIGGGLLTLPIGGWGAVPGSMIGRELAGYYAGEPESSRMRGAAITGAGTAATVGAGNIVGASTGPGTSLGTRIGTRIGAGALTGASTPIVAGYAQGRPAGETWMRGLQGGVTGAATSGAGMAAGYGLSNGTPIYNSEPGTDFSGSVNYQPGLMAGVGSRIASTGTGMGLQAAWKPYMDQPQQTPLWNNPYVQQGMQGIDQPQPPIEEPYDPYGELGKRVEQNPFSHAPITEQERQINRLLARQKLSGLGPLSPYLTV